LRRPQESTNTRVPNLRFIKPSAMGERMAFMVQQNKTD